MCTRRLQSPRCSCLAGLPSQQEGRCGDGSAPLSPGVPALAFRHSCTPGDSRRGRPRCVPPHPSHCSPRLLTSAPAPGSASSGTSLAGSAHWACASEGPLCLTAARQLVSVHAADSPLLGVLQFSHPFTRSGESSPESQFKSINSSGLSLLYSPTLTFVHDCWKNHSFD